MMKGPQIITVIKETKRSSKHQDLQQANILKIKFS